MGVALGLSRLVSSASLGKDSSAISSMILSLHCSIFNESTARRLHWIPIDQTSE